MELNSEFTSFLTEIRPTENQRAEMKSGHATLRTRLQADAKLSPLIVSDFLQGCYRRSTAVRPKGGKRSDVDIVVVTTLSEAEYTPEQAMALFIPFLDEHYKGKWRPQGRSFGIEMSHVDLDLVITSAPSEAELSVLKSDAVRRHDELGAVRFDAVELLKAAAAKREWAASPLRIPDREARKWDDTHPLEQLRVTWDKSASTNGHFVNVVKAIKWSRLKMFPDTKHPKGFPLERMVGDCCPDIGSVAEGIVRTLETMVTRYATGKPVLGDYGVPNHDVLGRLAPEGFATFYEEVKVAADIARRAFDCGGRAESSGLWQQLLGSKFPTCEDDSSASKAGFVEPRRPAWPASGRFA